MLYYLFEYLDKLDVPGAGVFQYISFRSAITIIFSLVLSTIYGKRMIHYLQRKQIGESIRDLGLEGQMQKKGTPTMGGIIILGSIIIPTLLFGDLKNIYIILILFTTIFLGFVGFLDDYIKVFKKNKEGLAGNFKIAGQVLVGIIVGATLYFSDDVVVREKILTDEGHPIYSTIVRPSGKIDQTYQTVEVKSIKSTIPFIKNNEIDYSKILGVFSEKAKKWSWIPYILIVIFVVTAVSNGSNLTDGLDGLATGLSAIIGATLGILAYVSGNMIFSDYLNIMYIPNTGELVVFISAFVGALIGFMWYNSYPAQVFMGDTGSLAIGGIIAVFALIIRKELLIPILCGIFFVESLSVIIQVFWFKYTKRKYGEGKRVFRMSPLHHHYQIQGYPEPKIVTRFWITGILLAVITIVTLKIR